MQTKVLATAAFILLAAGAAWAAGDRPPAATPAPAPTAQAAVIAAAPLALEDVLGAPAPVWLTDCCQAYQDCLAACPTVGHGGHVACVGACNIAYRGCC